MDVKGTPKELWVRVTRKLGDNDFGSYGTEAELQVSLANVKDLDLGETFASMHAFLTSAVAEVVKSQGQETSQLRLEAGASATKQPATVAQNGATAGFGPPAGETVAPAAESHSEHEKAVPVEVVKFTLARRTDKKFQLELYQMYGKDVGDYPDIKFVASREDMWNLIGDFVQTFDLSTLPIEENVKWYADWEHGREFKNSKGEVKRYKDLTGLRQR